MYRSMPVTLRYAGMRKIITIAGYTTSEVHLYELCFLTENINVILNIPRKSNI